MIGRTLGDYRIVDRLGAGGMGEVYRAHDAKLQRDVALKVLPAGSFSDATARARLLREARAAARLNHPNICTIHDVGEAQEQAYIAMELVEGEPLSARVARGPLPEEQTARYALQLADALAHAHDRGIVHRDLKSANIVITPDGRAKVLDFGLARRVQDAEADEITRSQVSLTESGAVMGTLAYMAPEQLRGEPADARSDIWALGVVVYEMAAGARPFRGNTGFQVSSAILSEPPRPLPSQVPAGLRSVIERCLEKEPGRRYQRAGQVRAALEVPEAGMRAPSANWRRVVSRRPRLALAGALVIGALVVTALLAAFDIGGVRTRLAGTPGASRIESIAVLPLENLSGDSGQDYFAVGMTETLITDLARLGGLKRVTARGSVMRYKGTTQRFAEIARDLRVDALVTGSILRAGDVVSVTVQLVDPATDDQIWANRYERDLKDIIRLQNEIVSAIVREVKIQLTPREQARLASGGAVNPEAYDAYLRGRIEYSRLSEKSLDVAMEYFDLALRKDPGFALAHEGVAGVWAVRGHLGFLPPPEVIPRVRAAASRALALDEDLPEIHGRLANLHFYFEWDWDAAEREWQRVRELDPNHARDPGRAVYSAAMGHPEGTSAVFEQLLDADPHNPSLRDFYGHHLVRLRRYDDGILQFRKVLSTEPTFHSSHHGLWRAFHLKRMHKEALTSAEDFFLARGYPEAAARLKEDYRRMGYAAAMRGAAAVLVERSRAISILPTLIARAWAFGGEKALALDWLEKAFRDGDTMMVYLKIDPTFDTLRDDPRFQALLRKMNFPS